MGKLYLCLSDLLEKASPDVLSYNIHFYVINLDIVT